MHGKNELEELNRILTVDDLLLNVNQSYDFQNENFLLFFS